jgi:hypothetical protein
MQFEFFTHLIVLLSDNKIYDEDMLELIYDFDRLSKYFINRQLFWKDV